MIPKSQSDTLTWQARQICLTESQLVFAREESAGVIDELELLLISSCIMAFSKTQQMKALALVRLKEFHKRTLYRVET